MAIKIELEPKKTSLTIGDQFAKENEIEFTIKLTGDEPVWLKLQIPVGNDGVLQQREDANYIEVATPGTEPKPKPQKYVNDIKEWSLGNEEAGVSVKGSAKVSVSIKNILCRASVGESKLTISGDFETAPQPDACTLKITKAKPTEIPKNPILYFTAEPKELIGEGTVELKWEVAGDQDVSLKAPGLEVSNPKSPYKSEWLSKGYTFSLTATKQNQSRSAHVNVLERGWHPLYPLDKTALPSVIFDPGYADKDGLYAIFIGHGLCKSANGMTGWRIVKNDAPDGMESSPGVRLGNRLWLIGGSAVDPDRKSNSIWYIELDRDMSRSVWKKAGLLGADAHKFEARMGHACVIVNDATFWVLGGLGRYRCLNDVWSFKIEGDNLRASRLLESSEWNPRCMFSAVRREERIWLCGGVDSPNGNPLGDLWTTQSGSDKQVWKERPRRDKGSGKEPYVIANAIGTGATCVGKKLITVFTSREGAANRQSKGKMSRLERDTPEGDDWTTDELTGLTKPDWTIDPHGITIVSFQNRLYLRYLHRDALQPGKQDIAPLYVYVDPELKPKPPR